MALYAPFSVPAVLAIAGSDSSGGAGIQADIKTIAAHGLFAETAITALTAQNTTGVRAIEAATAGMVASQIDAVFEDIRPAAVKIGMVSSIDVITTIAQRLTYWNAENVVLDPVMVATSGARLISKHAVMALVTQLFPLARLITPNFPEAGALTNTEITTVEDQEAAARALTARYGCATLVKGGHGSNDANDVLAMKVGDDIQTRWFLHERVENKNTHGTGCTLSSAIACGLALGKTLDQAIADAKDYLTGALEANIVLGHGSGPLDHMWRFRTR